MPIGRVTASVAAVVISGFGWILGTPTPAGATTVTTEATLRAAFADPSETAIVLGSSVDLVDCSPTGGDLDRNSVTTLTIDGAGFTVRQTCAGERVAEQVGVGALTFSDITVTGGDLHEDTSATSVNGGGITSAGDVTVRGSVFSDNHVTNSLGQALGGAVVGVNVDVEDSVIVDNVADGGTFSGGGGIAGLAVTVTGSTVDRNLAQAAGNDTHPDSVGAAGGGIVARSTISLADSNVGANRASVSALVNSVSASGGGVATQGAEVSLASTHVDGNSVEADGGSNATTTGGGILAGTVRLDQSTVDGNINEAHGGHQSFAAGGGIYVPGHRTSAQTDVSVDASSVSGNAVVATDGSGSSAEGGGVDAMAVRILDSRIDTNRVDAPDFATGGGLVSPDPTIVRTSIVGNRATASRTSGLARGGGLAVFGTTGTTMPSIDSSTISGNAATSPEGALGGGISLGTQELGIVNSTVTGNEAGGLGTGGGIGNPAIGGRLRLVYTTVVGNTAAAAANVGTGAAFPNDPSTTNTLSTFATVVASPLGGGTNCGGDQATDSSGYDASDDTSCGFDGATDRAIGDPRLGDLANNGGPTSTLLPAPTSPLVDVIPVDACQSDAAVGVTTDQHGVTRPQGSGCDIGAVEIAGIAAPTSIVVVPHFTG